MLNWTHTYDDGELPTETLCVQRDSTNVYIAPHLNNYIYVDVDFPRGTWSREDPAYTQIPRTYDLPHLPYTKRWS